MLKRKTSVTFSLVMGYENRKTGKINAWIHQDMFPLYNTVSGVITLQPDVSHKHLVLPLVQCSSTFHPLTQQIACYKSFPWGSDSRISQELLMSGDIQMEKHDIFLSDLLL